MAENNRISAIFSRNLRRFRTEKKLTQEELAERVGVSNQVISRYELGKMNPSFDTLEKISEVLFVEVYRFFIDEQNSVRVISEQNLDETGRKMLAVLQSSQIAPKYKIER